MKGSFSKLGSNVRLLAFIVIFIVVVASIGSVGLMLRKEPEEKDYVLEAVITCNTTTTYVWEEILFDASETKGDIVLYLWDFGDGDTTRGVNATRAFEESRYYNVYLTVTDSKGDQDITMVNISIFNRNTRNERTGLFLDSSARRGPSSDWTYLIMYGGLTRPTLYANWTATTECAYLQLSVYHPDGYYSDNIICMGEDLEVRLVFEDIEFDRGEYFVDMNLRCERGYIMNYQMELGVVY